MFEVRFQVNIIEKEIVDVSWFTLFGQQYLCMAPQGIMDVIPGRTFRFLIASAWSFVVSLTKH